MSQESVTTHDLPAEATSEPNAFAFEYRVGIGLCLIVLAIYAQTVWFNFVTFDDAMYVYGNPYVRSGLTTENVAWAFTSRHGGNWHPLTSLSHMLDSELYPMRPGGHHLTSVLLHAATAVALFLALVRLTGDLWPCAICAGLFAIHPLRVESVAWIAERKDVLSGLFFALTLLAYARYVRRRSLSRYGLVALMFALGLMAKPMLVTVPFVLLLFDYWPLGRFAAPGATRRLLLEKFPLLILSAACCAATIWAQEEAIAAGARFSLWDRFANGAVAYVIYIRQTFWPSGLIVFYPYPEDGRPIWEVIGALTALAAITAIVIACRQRRPYLFVGWLWYLGMLVPAIGLVQAGGQSHADRYTYLPQIGLLIGLVWLAFDLTAKCVQSRKGLSVAVVGLVALLSWCSWRQTGYWRDGVALFTHALDWTPDNALAHNNLGCALDDRHADEEAGREFEKAIELEPGFVQAHFNLGLVRFRQGRLDEAEACFEKALSLDPQSSRVREGLENVRSVRATNKQAPGPEK